LEPNNNDDVPIDGENGRRVAEVVAATSSTAAKLVKDHVAEHEEVLPTLLLDVVGQWFVDTEGRDDDASRAVEAVGQLLEHGDHDIRTIVVTGLLEALPHPGESGHEVIERLPTSLREELRKLEDWRPS
jgi:hypothetical protein